MTTVRDRSGRGTLKQHWAEVLRCELLANTVSARSQPETRADCPYLALESARVLKGTHWPYAEDRKRGQAPLPDLETFLVVADGCALKGFQASCRGQLNNLRVRKGARPRKFPTISSASSAPSLTVGFLPTVYCLLLFIGRTQRCCESPLS